MTLQTKEDTIFGEEIDEEEEILEIDEEDIDEEIDEEDIDDDEEILLDDEEEEEEEEADIILDDLDELINELDDEEEEEKEEKIVEKRTSFPILTKYEKNFIIGFRTQQIINGSVILIDINKLKVKSAYTIAQQELAEKKIPFKVKRHFPDGKVEIWDLEDLMIL